MLFVLQWLADVVIPLALIAGGLVLGLLVERLLLPRIIRLATKTGWEGDEMLARALRGVTTLLFVLLSAAAALYIAVMEPALKSDLEQALLVAFIIWTTAVLARLAAGFIGIYARKAQEILPSTSTSFFTNLTKITIYILGILVALGTLGISIAPALTALGIGGLAVALALQDPLQNLFSGLQLIISRPIRTGDYVTLSSGEAGYVTDISWRNTTIRELANNMIIVPNYKLAGAIIKNYHLPDQQLAVLLDVGVSYDSDLVHVEQVTIEVAREVLQEVQGGVIDFEPFIRYHTFGDFSINFSVILRGNEFVDQFLLKHEFVKRLHARYQQEGISIPFPIRTVHLEQPGPAGA